MRVGAQILLCYLAAAASGINLTWENYYQTTNGKAVFLKFFVPWCKQSQRIKPLMDDLVFDYGDHESYVVGRVDCAAEQKLCQRFYISGYPTFLYGHPQNPEEYRGNGSLQQITGAIEVSACSFALALIEPMLCRTCRLLACLTLRGTAMRKKCTSSRHTSTSPMPICFKGFKRWTRTCCDTRLR